MDTGRFRATLSRIADLLDAGSDPAGILVRDALAGAEETLARFLTSNELWGGAGSVADQGLINDPDRRRELECLLIELGRLQIAGGSTNVRTAMWTNAFESFARRSAK